MSTPPADEQATTVRLSADRHEWVRRESFERRVPMRQVIEEAIDALRDQRATGDAPAPAATRIREPR